ncbi:YD repeat-containing protein [Streptomyces sp. B4I13]|nr:YD repeat-containing protein [Streptomyces sp. B4I13]
MTAHPPLAPPLSAVRHRTGSRDPTGDTAGDITRTYRYDENGKGQPNTLTSVSSTGAVTGKDTFTYEPGGGTESRAPSGGVKQSFVWDSEGNLASATQGSSTTEYLYDAEGKRLISRSPGGVSTLYLGATEITWTKTTGKTTARRYYDLGGASAVRQDDGSLSLTFMWMRLQLRLTRRRHCGRPIIRAAQLLAVSSAPAGGRTPSDGVIRGSTGQLAARALTRQNVTGQHDQAPGSTNAHGLA